MHDRVDSEAALAEALRLTADAPAAWIDAAVLIPITLGDLAAIERLAGSAGFRARFEDDPAGAVSAAGLEPSVPVLSALRHRLRG
jgi:hypothetical protein